MRKIIWFFTLVVFVCSQFLWVVSVWANANISIEEFVLRVNNWANTQGIAYAKPWDVMRIMIGWPNNGGTISDVSLEYTFSHFQFAYEQPETIDTYKNGEMIYQNVSLSEFHPPSDNILPVASSVETWDYLSAYDLRLKIDQNTKHPLWSIGANFRTSWWYVWTKITRDIYVDVRPHIIDYFFQRSDFTPTTQVQWSDAESFYLAMKIKDFNGCQNISDGSVSANLSVIWWSTQTPLSFISCEWDGVTALFRTPELTVDVVGNYDFSPNMFHIVDADGNSFLLNDPDTPFDDIDKKTSFTLGVTVADAPVVEILNVDHLFVWGPEKQNSMFQVSANQSWEYKVIVGLDGACETGTLVSDWTSVLSWTPFTFWVSSSLLNEGTNSISICVKNSWGNIWGTNTILTKDITSPTLSNFVISPASVVLNDPNIQFICSEEGEFDVYLGGTGIWDGTFVSSWTLVANQQTSIFLTNQLLSLWINQWYVRCIDNASNSVSQSFNVNKVPPTPDMSWIITLIDADFDYEGIDGRDFSLQWDNSVAVWYENFESYRMYILPSLTPFQTNHTHSALVADASLQNYTFLNSVNTDSLWNPLISWENYKVCMAIMWRTWLLWWSICSSGVTIIWDEIYNPNILSARFIADTLLEITTDVTLDTDIQNHSGSLISFQYSGQTIVPTWVAEINGKKIILQIPSLSNLAATGSHLVVHSWSIRAGIWWFNHYFVSWFNISDAQNPTVTNFIIWTSSVFSNYYSGSINVSYSLWETLKSAGVTKIIFERTGGNSGENKIFHVANLNDLTPWNHTISIDLASLWLSSGTFYTLVFEGQDWASNYVSLRGPQLKYDAVWPNKVNIVPQANTSNASPVLSWNQTGDNSGNGSWVDTYTLTLFSGAVCANTPVQTHTTSQLSVGVWTLSNGVYSFRVVATDKLGNIGIVSDCDDFIVDVNIPTISNLQITDVLSGKQIFTKSTHQVNVIANLTNTNSGKIIADLSRLTGNNTHTWVICSTPVSWVSCLYNSGIVTYTFDVWFWWSVSQWSRQIHLFVTTPTDVTTVQENTTIIVDDIAPTMGNIISPSAWVYGGNVLNVQYNGISDTHLSHLRFEYSNNAGTSWNLIQTGSNIGNFDWNISALSTGNQYQLRIVALDGAWNVSHTFSPVFSIDKMAPEIAPVIFSAPIFEQVIAGWKTFPIIWNALGISDAWGLAAQPISLYYSTNNEQTWLPIIQNTTNSGTYLWSVPSTNLENVSLKMEVRDNVGNVSEQKVWSLKIDSIVPTLTLGIGTPPQASFINAKGFEFFGSAQDTHLHTVWYFFKRKVDNTYWNGNNFVTWSYLNILDTWISSPSYHFSQLIWSGVIQHGETYEFIVQAIDKAGNINVSPTREYIWDLVNPEVTTFVQPWTYFSQNFEILWTASDWDSGISSVKITIVKDGQYWNGNQYVPEEHLLSVITNDNYAHWWYNFASPISDNHQDEYEIWIYAYDKSYTVNNMTHISTSLIKDIEAPQIASDVFAFDTEKIYAGWDVMMLTWNQESIIDTHAWLWDNPIQLDYFDGIQWHIIAQNLANSGEYHFTLPLIDTPHMRIRISAEDRVWNKNSLISSAFVIDSTPPVILSIETMDRDANWQIDAILVEMSEPILDSSIQLIDFSLSWIWVPTGIETWNIANDSRFILTFANIGDTSTRPTLSYTQWNLQDLAGRKMESIINQPSIDKATPRILEISAYDRNKNGKLDVIVLEISEALEITSVLNGMTLHDPFLWMWLLGVTIDGTKIEISLNESSWFNTTTQNLALSYNGGFYQDLAGNSLWGFIQSQIIDKAWPILVGVHSLDGNQNGKFDTVQLQFSENIIWVNYTDFMISNILSDVNYTWSGSSTHNMLSLYMSETGLDVDTDTIPHISYVWNTIQDNSGNVLEEINNFIWEDKIPPKLIGAFTRDLNSNGEIDHIELLYSEELQWNTSWVLVNVGGYNVENIFVQSNRLLVEVQEKIMFDTQETPHVFLMNNTTISDQSWNIVPSMSIAWWTQDGVGPVIIGARYDQSASKVYLTFSEAIQESDFLSWNFELENAGNYSIASVNFSEKSITLQNEEIQYPDSWISFLAWQVRDIFWNVQTQNIFTSLTAPIIISEVLRSQDAGNNYVELQNMSEASVNISWYQVAWVNIPNDTILSAGWIYLIASSSHVTSILDIVPDFVSWDLDLNQNEIVLTNGIITIDRANMLNSFLDDILPASMERKFPVTPWNVLSSWYRAVVSVGFDTSVALWTPGSQNVQDSIAPELLHSSVVHNQILPYGTFDMSYEYEDDVDGVWVDSSSISLDIVRYEWGNWWPNVSTTYISWTPSISQTQSIFHIVWLPYWKYKAIFELQDFAGNVLREEMIFLVDAFQVEISNSEVDFWDVQPNAFILGDEVTVTIKTVGTPFHIRSIAEDLILWSYSVSQFDGTFGWWGYIDRLDSGYGAFESFHNQEFLHTWTVSWNGELYEYVYKFHYALHTSWLEVAGEYNANHTFVVEAQY